MKGLQSLESQAGFESFVQPLIVLLTLPLGVAGSLVALWLSGGY